MKINILNIFHLVLFVITIIAGIVGGVQESAVLSEHKVG